MILDQLCDGTRPERRKQLTATALHLRGLLPQAEILV
jgi:hypothetical protein